MNSAGLLLYRDAAGTVELLLGHMGGPFWAGRDDAAWSIPKGEYGPDENAHAAALREFAEELGSPAPDVDYVDLGTVRTSGGKRVTVWAGRSDFDVATVVSNTVEMAWPPRSGTVQVFPEIDRAAWFAPDVALAKLVKGQRPFVGRLLDRL